MNINRMLLLAGAALCAVTALAETTIEGITVVAPGFTVNRYRPKTKEGVGRDIDGNPIQVTTIADIQGYVDRGEYDAFRTTTSPALAGYKAQFGGLFAYDGCEPDGGYPGENRWDRMDYQYFTMDGSISVPSAGKWTFGLGGRENSRLALKITDSSGTVVLDKELTSHYKEDGTRDGEETHFFVCDLAVGEYAVAVRQFSPEAAVWYEISYLKGDFYEITDRNDIWTWKGMATIVGAPLTTYDVIFDSQGGSAVEAQHVKAGKSVTEPTAPLKEGSAFICWTADPSTNEPYDFSTVLTSDLTLTAVWTSNNAPVISGVTSTPSALEMQGSTGEIALEVAVTDADGDPLTYAWTVEGEVPAPYSFDDSSSATPTVTVQGPGTYVFKVTVSDGHDTVSSTVSVEVTVAKGATTFKFVGCDATLDITVPEKLLNPTLADYPWSSDVWPFSQFKGSWRSTNTAQKVYLIDDKRPNAYGLDGYAFIGGCRNGDGTVGEDGRLTSDGTKADHVTTGSVTYNRDNYEFFVSDVTPYIEKLDFVRARIGYSASGVCEIGDGPVYYCIDDPRLPLDGEVKDFQPSSVSVHVPAGQDVFVPFATIKFNRKVLSHPKVRIGFLAGGREKFKPQYISVGSAVAPWGGRDDFNRNWSSASPDWMFFDIDNAKPGDVVTLSIKTTDNQWDQGQIHGIIFDSTEVRSGFAVIVR